MKSNDAILVERDIPCTVRDGTKLYANIYRPSSEGTFPVLLTRLPYNKNLPDFSHRYVDPIRMARCGYVVIIQDVRGRYASEGEFRPFVQESKDGYDTVEWSAQLPYCDGNVGMFGLSYYGFTQMYAAVERPPSLKAIFPVMTGSGLQDGLVYRGGAFELGLFETWMLDSVAPDYLNRIQPASLHIDEINRDLNHIFEWYKYRPVDDWPPLKKHPHICQLFNRYIHHLDTLDKVDITDELEELDIPAFHIAGWYDCFLGPTLTNFMEMNKGRQSNQKLLVGPWAHGDFSAVIGERFFQNQSSGSTLNHRHDLTSLHIDWFNWWLKGRSAEVIEEKPVQIFIMGTNQWRAENEWPLERTQYTPFYFQGNGCTRVEGGGLSTRKPIEEGRDVFFYNSQDPVPTKGGGTLFYQGLNKGPMDQRELERREDVVVYTTPPLDSAIEVTGPITVVLWVASTASSTDFTAKLVDVLPDGTSFNLTDGIIRAEDLSGGVIRIEIDLWATSNVFKQGHSIGLHISSSNFPRYDVNSNGESGENDHQVKNIRQAIYHGGGYASHIILPVIPE